MDIYMILVTIHVLAFAWGVGGATASDILFLKSLKDRVLTRQEFSTLSTVSTMVIIGLVVAILSGASLLGVQYINTGKWALLADGRFQMKITLVALLALNGIIFHAYVFPLLRRHVGRTLDTPAIASRLWLFSLTGSISITAWYGVTLLALIKRASVLTYLELGALYLVALGCAGLISYGVITRTIIRPKK